MLSNVSDDLASGMEGDRRLLTYCYILTKNAILGMHLAFFGWDERSTYRVLVGWHARWSGSSTNDLFYFSHFNFEGMDFMEKEQFFFIFGQRCVEMSGFTPGQSPRRTMVLHVRVGLTGQQLEHL